MGMIMDGLSHWQAETEQITLLDVTMGDLLGRRAEELPTQEAIVYSCYPEFGDALNQRWTYQDYQQRVNVLAKGLLTLELHKGDHIAIWALNRSDAVTTTLAPLPAKTNRCYTMKKTKEAIFSIGVSGVTEPTGHGRFYGSPKPQLMPE